MSRAKRILDLCGAAAALLITFPLLLIVAVAVKLDSPGPILYRPTRIGRGGRPFRLYKFRSMVMGADTGPAITGNGDARVTRVGRLIRPLRIDELPQLVNVLKGDMSLVGPRPESPEVVAFYTSDQRQVLTVRPGITGPTQLAWLGESEALPSGGDSLQYYATYLLPYKLQSDLRYVRTQSLIRDLGYLVQTPLRLMSFALARWRLNRAARLTRLVTDLAAVVLATFLAFLARFDGDIPLDALATLVAGLPITAGAYGLIFVSLKTYRSIWRYAGVEDFWQLVKACALAGGLSAAVLPLLPIAYPRTVIVLTPVLALLLMGGARLAWRSGATSLVRRWGHTRGRRVVIVGAGRTGESIAREISSSPRLGYRAVGFIDDDPRLQGAMLRNLPVLGTIEHLPEIVRRHRIDEAIIAIPRMSLADLRRIGDACGRAGIEFKSLPSMSQLVQGEGRLRYLRKVDVTELLRREALAVSPETIRAFLAGKKVLVTGAGGSVGSELCRQIAQFGAEALLMVDRAENGLFEISAELQGRTQTRLSAALADVKHVTRMEELLAAFTPDLVFHAAAYKHVPILESHPTEAVLNNVVGTVRLAHLARTHRVGTFVFISTDKAVRPSNLMGATKRLCELYLIALNSAGRARNGAEQGTRFRVVRFGNVLGSAGSALPLFQRQIESGSPITITDPEVSRFFMTIQEAVALLLESATLDIEGDITVLDMGEPVRITKLADDLVTAMGLPTSAVARRIIGLRPGEKLHEALWEDTDQVVPSPHPRILSLRQPSRSLEELEEMETLVRDLERQALQGDSKRVLALLGQMVPSYRPQWETSGPPLVQVPVTPAPAARTPSTTGLTPILRPAVNQVR